MTTKAQCRPARAQKVLTALQARYPRPCAPPVDEPAGSGPLAQRYYRLYAARQFLAVPEELADELEELCRERRSALFYASNFSLGVNLLFRLNRQLAAMIDRVSGYDVRIEEVHHIQKKDAPSGTAITLAEGIIGELGAKNGWVNDEHAPADRIAIRSVREGTVPGTHTVTYESEDDILELRHTIKNRRTLAMGAVVAAEFLCGKEGVYTMDDLLK